MWVLVLLVLLQPKTWFLLLAGSSLHLECEPPCSKHGLLCHNIEVFVCKTHQRHQQSS